MQIADILTALNQSPKCGCVWKKLFANTCTKKPGKGYDAAELNTGSVRTDGSGSPLSPLKARLSELKRGETSMYKVTKKHVYSLDYQWIEI
jgi:hypothetical protein